MRTSKVGLIWTLALPLAACGGGGGSGPISTPAPSPAPAPTPTPTPTPTPAPTPISINSPGSRTGVSFTSGVLSNQYAGVYSGVSFDAATNTSNVVFFPSAGAPGGSADPNNTRTLSYGPAQATSSAGNFRVFQQSDPVDPTHTDTLRVSKPGAENTSIALTYTSFAIQEVSNGSSFLQRDYFVFGSPTANVPVTGTGSYNGILEGTYYKIDTGQTYILAGTSTLTADFSALTVAASINFTGSNIAPGQAGLAALQFSGTGNIISTNPGTQYLGTMTAAGLPGSALFNGNFYGNNAEEFGYAFLYSGVNDRFNGIAVGKR
jgi:hypothetical protein